MSEAKMKVPIFDGFYEHWREMMENLLRAKQLWHLVDPGIREPTAGIAQSDAQRKRLEELRVLDLQVKHYLYQVIDRVTFEHILDRTTSKAIWDSMKQRFTGNERVKKSMLQKLHEEATQTDVVPAREGRIRRPPSHLNDYVTEASKHKIWNDAMDMEIQSIERNETWTLTDLPIDVKCIGVKWVYKTKLNEKGKIDKHKARLVVKGYCQDKQGVNFHEVYALVARMDTIRLIIAMAAQNGWSVFQMDVKSAFLYGTLHEESNRGLFLKEGFVQSEKEDTMFVKKSLEGGMLIVNIYVDDLIYTGNCVIMLLEFKQSMMKEFEMTDLGQMKYFLGIEVKQTDCGIHISQHKYVVEVLKRFNMSDCNPVINPIVP
nr:copia-type polyprotein [Tanacetum cinerariifolium]